MVSFKCIFDSLVSSTPFNIQLQFDHEITYPCAFSILVMGDITGLNSNNKYNVSQRDLVSQRHQTTILNCSMPLSPSSPVLLTQSVQHFSD